MDKVITGRIKSLLSLAGKRNIDLAAYLEISPQSLQNKFNRGSFSADDLIKIGAFVGAELSYSIGENKVLLDQSCIREKPIEE